MSEEGEKAVPEGAPPESSEDQRPPEIVVERPIPGDVVSSHVTYPDSKPPPTMVDPTRFGEYRREYYKDQELPLQLKDLTTPKELQSPKSKNIFETLKNFILRRNRSLHS